MLLLLFSITVITFGYGIDAASVKQSFQDDYSPNSESTDKVCRVEGESCIFAKDEGILIYRQIFYSFHGKLKNNTFLIHISRS